MKKVALVGYGYLGQAYSNVFPDAVIYDPYYAAYDPNGVHLASMNAGPPMHKPYADTKDEVNKCDIAIVAVPTDYTPDGKLDTSIIEDVISWLETPTILIKSALQPGTTDRLVKETGKNIAVSVEFIGEQNYFIPPELYPDPKNPKKHRLLIIGGEEPARTIAAEVLWEQMSPDTRIHLVTALEAEITKMAENTFGALKVTWANVLRDVCDKYGANFIQVHQAWSEDGRVNPMHTRSVAHKRGWNSKCYDKDVRAFANISDSEMIKGLVADNERHLNA